MKKISALKAILGVSLFGLIFSGYLSYQEFFGENDGGCDALGQPGTIFGYPPCVYGFFMYLVIATLATLGVKGEKK